jgi:hypothetical protein
MEIDAAAAGDLASARTLDAPESAPPRPAPVPLEYAGRLPPRWAKLSQIWARIRDLGPLFPWPSLLTLGLFLACVGASYWLHYAPEPWRLLSSHWVGQTNGHLPNVQYLRGVDAVVSPNSAGGLRIWRPWTKDQEVLLNTEAPPITLPPNPPPGRKGELWWVRSSADESTLLARSGELGDFIFDARTGRCLAEHSSYLGPEAAKQPYLTLGDLSPDGSRLCVLNDKHELLIYDITGPKGVLLAQRQMQPLPVPHANSWETPRFRIRFSPDGKAVTLTSEDTLWLGDAETLEERLTVPSTFCWYVDLAFIRGGSQFLTIVRAAGDDQVRLYETATGKLLRKWQMPGDPSGIVVSPGEERALVALSHQASAVIDLAQDSDVATRRAAGMAFVNAPPPFFPDGRRAILVSESSWEYPTLVDTATGRHLGAFYPPGLDWLGPHVMVAADGRHVAFVGRNQLHVYEQVGSDSAWGVLATWSFWTLTLCVALFVASAARDALHTRRRWSRTAPFLRRRVALIVVLLALGGTALVTAFTCTALELRVWWGWSVFFNQVCRWFDDYGGWTTCAFAIYLLAALGLLMGSRAWTALLALALLASIGWALWFAWTVEPVHLPVRVFDRMWVMSPASRAVVHAAWAALAFGGLVALLTKRRLALPPVERPT